MRALQVALKLMSLGIRGFSFYVFVRFKEREKKRERERERMRESVEGVGGY